ncbi:MAG: CBS domain-containing protein [Bdellovibrionota bacterium]|nr:MAG: CBS domain-containing protein [Bdellovibrionota bacterium]
MTDRKEGDELLESLTRVGEAIRGACSKQIGVLDSSFLCQSLSVLKCQEPEMVAPTASLRSVVEMLRARSIGCVLVGDSTGKLLGIFSERDLLVKALVADPVPWDEPIERFMTAEPVAEMPTTTVAFALTLMSQGGFRHLPLIDQDGVPIGIVSIKDIVDFIVSTLMQDLEGLEA